MPADSIETLIEALANGGIQINLWPTERGFQANVKEQGETGWTIRTDTDPLAALRLALLEKDRATRDLARRYRNAPKAAAATPVDIEDVLG